MSVNPNDVIRVAAKLLGPAAQQIINVFFYKYTSVEGPVTDDQFMTAVAAQIDDFYEDVKTAMNEDYTDDEIEFYNITQDVPMGTKLFDGFQGGTGIGDAFPAGVAALITASTAVKKVLPKKFIAGFIEGQATLDTWGAGALALLATAAATWLTEVEVAGVGLAVPGTWRRVALAFAPLVSATAKAIVSYQRRRKPGVGS